MRKNSHGKILRMELKEQHLSIVPMSRLILINLNTWIESISRIRIVIKLLLRPIIQHLK